MGATAMTIEQKQTKKQNEAKANLAKYTFGANAPVVKAGQYKADDCRVDVNTLQWEPSVSKNSVEIISIYSGERRRVYTSDVFQLNGTEAEMKQAKKDAKAAAKADRKEALELGRANQQ